MHRSGDKSYFAHLGASGEDQFLSDHLWQVSAICKRLGGKIGMARAGELIGLMHDIGKYSEAFQQYLCEAADNAEMEMEPRGFGKGRIDHSTAGAQWCGASWHKQAPVRLGTVRSCLPCVLPHTTPA